jgi:hypothetical protein
LGGTLWRLCKVERERHLCFEAPIREEVEENMDLLAFETDNPKMAWETISLFGFLKDLLELVFGSMICLMNLTHEMRVFQQRQGLH